MADDWLSEQLSSLLLFPVPQDMIDYIKSISNVRDLEDYMKTLLDFENSHHKRFLQELIQRRKGNTKVGYRKNEVEQDYIAPKVEKKKKEKGNKPQVSNTVTKELPTEQPGHSKKKKFVNMYSQEGRNRDIVLLKGRHRCDCQASKHRLINNCLKCGRIVCEQEGSGPCLFCTNLVCSRDEQEMLNSGSKQSSQLLQKLMDQKPPGYEAALEQRNRLLEYDRTSEKRTRVIDDESDYFSANSVWLSAAERESLKKKEEEMHARKHKSRKDRILTLDLGLRKMVEASPAEDEFNLNELDEVLQDISNSVNTRSSLVYDGETVHPSSDIQPVFDEEVQYRLRGSPLRALGQNVPSLTSTKVQDREYLEMVDEGLCLSMHQPWASLLVCGIKVHEGRNWYTSHRGRLWIASTARAPDTQEVKDTEVIYKTIKPDAVLPLTYPTGCLLGCVSVADCLPQEEYRSRFPDGESDSPFVFICENSHQLPIKFPISGKHKIYKLDPLIHQAAQKALQRVAKIMSEHNSQSFLRNS